MPDDEFGFRYNPHGDLALAFRTLLGYSATRESTAYATIRGAGDTPEIIDTPSRKEQGRSERAKREAATEGEHAMTPERSAQTEYLPGVYENRPRGKHVCRGLFAATESFGVSLWDLPWEISNADRQTAIERSRRLARGLLARGWAPMIVEPWAASDSERDVALDEALAVLERDETWEPSHEMFSLVATERGRDVSRQHNLRRRLHRVGFNH